MAVKKVKPTSPGRRAQSYSTFDEITRVAPEKSLLKVLKKKGGRNVYGRITCRHRGGGNKRHYRIIDFKREKTGIPGKVATIEYDPNRSARIALLHYVDGEKRYILAPVNLCVGDTVLSGPDADELLAKLFPGSSAANPIDVLATGNAEQIGECIDYCNERFDSISAIVIIFGTSGLTEVFDVYDVIHEKMLNGSKPIFPVLPSVGTAGPEVKSFISKGHFNFPDEVLLGKALGNVRNTPKPFPAAALATESFSKKPMTRGTNRIHHQE